jgi:hypothetical protein
MNADDEFSRLFRPRAKGIDFEFFNILRNIGKNEFKLRKGKSRQMDRDDNFHELFDTQYEACRIMNKLKYGYSERANYDEILDALDNEILEVQNAFWSAVDRYAVERGYYEEIDPRLIPFKNDLLVENFTEKFGWNRKELLDRFGV